MIEHPKGAIRSKESINVLPPKKLVYSKSLKLKQSITTSEAIKASPSSNTQENQIDFIHEPKPKQPLVSMIGNNNQGIIKNKIILITKSGDDNICQKKTLGTYNKSAEVNESMMPLRKVSDLIKNLNSEKNNASVVPSWKDLALKKKSVW